LLSSRQWSVRLCARAQSDQIMVIAISYICTKQQFIDLLTAAFKDYHIKNSKNVVR